VTDTVPPGALDTLGMFDAAHGLADQLVAAEAAGRAVDGLPSGEGVTSVLVLGMGGSGIGGDVCAAVATPTARVPVLVSKHYECPAHVGPDTLVLAVSFSGNTEETIEAATAARAAGARLVVVAAGGRLVELAGEWGVPVLPVDPSIPMPRAGLGAVSIPLLVVLERLGLTGGIADDVAAAVAQLRVRSLQLAGDDGVARSLARRIGRTLPLVYGGGPLGEVAAWRWKGQFNENPKVAAFANRIPELTHNELCGWAQHGDVTRQVFTLVLLRHDFEHPQVRRRFDFVVSACDEVVADVVQVEAQGDGRLAQLFDLVLVGDLVTLQMAANEGVDPGPVDVLDQLKAHLRT
jgi:glucose/mannose-6-phosphate isomerase